MRTSIISTACAATFLLAACAETGHETTDELTTEAPLSGDTMSDMAEPAPPAAMRGTGDRDIPSMGEAVGGPKLAYTFGYAYQLPGTELPRLMRRHANVCEEQGPATCRILGMDLSGSRQDDDVRGTLQLAVAAPQARAIGALLENEAEDIGAEQLSASIASDELSKQMVDTEARLRTRIALRDRLLEVLRTRKGKVSELVEAERGVAQVNEEIDQANSWLAEMRGRVSFTRVELDYSTGEAMAGSFLDPIKGAAGSVGGILGMIIAASIVLGAIAVPLGTLVWLFLRLRRRYAAPSDAVAA